MKYWFLLLMALNTAQADNIKLNYQPTANDLKCLAKNIYFEAGNQSMKGKEAVASVTLNRVNSKRFPNTVCGVVKKAYKDSRGNPLRNKCHYSWYCDGKSDKIQVFRKGKFIKKDHKAWMDSVKVAVKYLKGKGKDVTGGADHYHNPYTSNPGWKDKTKVTALIGEHKFYKLYEG